MKAHVELYKELLRSNSFQRKRLITETPLEVIQEIAEDGVAPHLSHYADRFSEMLAFLSPSRETDYAMGRIFSVANQGPESDAASSRHFVMSRSRNKRVAQCLYQQGVREFYNGDDEGAWDYFSQSVIEGYREAHMGLGCLRTLSDFTDISREEIYCQAFPTDDPHVHQHFGFYLTTIGKLQKAQEHFRAAVELGEPKAAYLLGRIQQSLGSTQDAIESMILAATYGNQKAIPDLACLGLSMEEIKERIQACDREETMNIS